MAHPSVYASLIGGYEVATGVLLLKGGRAALLAFILRAHLKLLRA
jgi:hypothetical protein